MLTPADCATRDTREVLDPFELGALAADFRPPRAPRASGVTIREAVRHLPEAQRAAVLAARSPPAGRTRG